MENRGRREDEENEIGCGERESCRLERERHGVFERQGKGV